MTNHDDTELWTTLASQWQGISPAHDGPPTQLRDYVDRQARRIRRVLALDIAVTVASLAFVAWALSHVRGLFSVLVSADFAVVLVIVWTFSLVTGRGLWRASAASTAEYLALARRFALRRLHTAHLAMVMLVTQVAVVLLFFPRAPLSGDAPMGTLPVVGAIAWLAWAVVTRRRARRELRGLDEIEPPHSR